MCNERKDLLRFSLRFPFLYFSSSPHHRMSDYVKMWLSTKMTDIFLWLSLKKKKRKKLRPLVSLNFEETFLWHLSFGVVWISSYMTSTVIYQPLLLFFFFAIMLECFVCWVLKIKWNFITWIVFWGWRYFS